MNTVSTRLGTFSSSTIGGLNGVIIALALGLSAQLAVANMSNSTSGRIHGRAPTVTGNIQILNPGGATAVTDNQSVNPSAKPNQFTLSTNYSGLTVTDLDGDTGLTKTVNPAQSTLSWKHGSTTLTTAQLSQSFSPGWEGETLQVIGSATVTASSSSGIPRSNVTNISTIYKIVVPGLPWSYLVNNQSFTPDSGFPTTGFTGATYQIIASSVENNSKFDWIITPASAASWVTVSSSGVVKYTGTATSNNKTYTVTAKNKISGIARVVKTTTLARWYIVAPAAAPYDLPSVKAFCQGKGSTLATVEQLTNAAKPAAAGRTTSGTRAAGSNALWSQWGSMRYYMSSVPSGSNFYSWTNSQYDANNQDSVNGQWSYNYRGTILKSAFASGLIYCSKAL